jgi:hypothetical protein
VEVVYHDESLCGCQSKIWTYVLDSGYDGYVQLSPNNRVVNASLSETIFGFAKRLQRSIVPKAASLTILKPVPMRTSAQSTGSRRLTFYPPQAVNIAIDHTDGPIHMRRVAIQPTRRQHHRTKSQEGVIVAHLGRQARCRGARVHCFLAGMDSSPEIIGDKEGV